MERDLAIVVAAIHILLLHRPLSFNFLITLYMSAVYSVRLETTCFYKKPAEYVYMLIIGIFTITVVIHNILLV